MHRCCGRRGPGCSVGALSKSDGLVIEKQDGCRFLVRGLAPGCECAPLARPRGWQVLAESAGDPGGSELSGPSAHAEASWPLPGACLSIASSCLPASCHAGGGPGKPEAVWNGGGARGAGGRCVCARAAWQPAPSLSSSPPARQELQGWQCIPHPAHAGASPTSWCHLLR